MIYTVIAEPRAIDELADIWTHTSDRKAVEDASNTVDAMLRTQPLSHGLATPTDRILFEPPLAIVFEVKPEDRLVILKQYYYMG